MTPTTHYAIARHTEAADSRRMLGVMLGVTSIRLNLIVLNIRNIGTSDLLMRGQIIILYEISHKSSIKMEKLSPFV